MRLFHLVKEYDAVGPAAHGLRQLAALVVADISRGRADQPRDGVLLHVLAHVDAHHVLLIIKERLRQRLGQFRLAHARGAQEQERADRPRRVGDARPRAQDGLRHLFDGLILADDALVQHLVQVQQLFALALHELCDRDARPAGDDAGDFLLRHLVAQQRAALLLALGDLFLLRQLALQLRKAAVLELRGAVEVVFALRLFNLRVDLLDLLAQLLHLADGLLLVLPLGLHLVEARAHVRKLLLDLGQMLLRDGVRLLLEGGLLDLVLHDLAADVVQLLGHGVHLGADHCAGLIDQVDGLVGQKTVGNIAVGQRRGGDERLVLNLDAVEDLVALLEAAQDGDGVLHRRLVDHHRLEAPLQRRVLLDVLAVFVERRSADAVQLAARQQGLEQVARVHGALGLARADDRVQLVDEQDDPALALLDLLQHGLEALLKLAAELRARDQRAHVQGEDTPLLEAVGHVAAYDALCQALGDRRLAHARLADEHRVVLRLAREDADDVAHLRVAPDDRVQLALLRQLHQIRAVLLEHVVGRFRAVAGHARVAAHGLQRREKFLFADAEPVQQLLHRAVALLQQRHEQMLHGDILVAHVLRLLLRLGEHRVHVRRDVDLPRLAARAAHARHPLDLLAARRLERRRIRAHLRDQLADQPLRLARQRI